MPEKRKSLRNIPSAFCSTSAPFHLTLVVVATTMGCTNFHEVTPDVLYRSKQLSGSQFDHFVKRYQIKTVINLRGAAPDSKWYQDEMNIMQTDSVAHLDIRLSAIRYVPPQKVDSIMVVAASATKPILVHCQGGADRSGLFCAAWKLKIEHIPAGEASKQLSVVYGHVPFFRSRTEAMDSSFHDYVNSLGDNAKR
jgi:undecaprenyl-diphosphatase